MFKELRFNAHPFAFHNKFSEDCRYGSNDSFHRVWQGFNQFLDFIFVTEKRLSFYCYQIYHFYKKKWFEQFEGLRMIRYKTILRKICFTIYDITSLRNICTPLFTLACTCPLNLVGLEELPFWIKDDIPKYTAIMNHFNDMFIFSAMWIKGKQIISFNETKAKMAILLKRAKYKI